MGFFDFFSKKNKKAERDILNLTLPDIRPGDFVDYDMKTWKVGQRGFYEWGEDDVTREWQLVSGNDTVYLEMEMEDEASWSVSRKISFQSLGDNVKKAISENGDPPETILYQGVEFHLEISGGGHYYEDGRPLSQKLLKWDYADDKGERFLSIEQWGENEFDASEGTPVQEYQFNNIIPASGS